METALYIHIPFCASKCSYCDFYSIACVQMPAWYIKRLEEEFLFRQKKFGIRKIKTIYFGGGTPSFLFSNVEFFDDIVHFFKTLKPYLAENAEITFECNPDDVSKELCEFLKFLGVNRISLGIQTFNDKKLTFHNRRSTKKINNRALKIIQKAGFAHFSADLISGLIPLGNLQEEEKELFKAIDILIKNKVDHISLYSLIIGYDTPLEKFLDMYPSFNDEELSDSLWIAGRDYLESKGFEQYEVSNFSLPGGESQHNLCYWNMDSYLGIGAGATGSLFFEGGIVQRYENTENLDEYLKKDFLESQENESIEKKDAIFEYLMMGFRKVKGIDEKVFYNRFKEKIENYIEPSFSNWEKKNLSKKENGFYALTKEGLSYLNLFLQELL